MARIIVFISALGWLWSAQAVPTPDAGGNRAVIRVLHVHNPSGYTCPVHESGQCCRDSTHWSIIVDQREFDVTKIDEACAVALAVATQDPKATSLGPDSDGSALLCVNKTAPFILVQRLAGRLATLGFSRVSVRESADLPDKVVEVRLRIDLDDDTQVVSRQVDGVPASDDLALKNLVKAAARNAKQTIPDPVVIVIIEASPFIAWESVTATSATCRIDGITAIETAVAPFR